MDQAEKRIIEIIEKNRSRIIAFGDDIYRHAELGYKEIRTAEKFRAFIEPLTQNYTDGLAITGAKAYINRDKRDVFSLALIGELDALRIPNHAFANPETAWDRVPIEVQPEGPVKASGRARSGISSYH